MPLFRVAPPPTDLRSAVQRAVMSMGAASNPLLEMEADQAAARTAHSLSLAEQARASAEQHLAQTGAIRRAEAIRADPNTRTRFAASAADMTDQERTRLADHLAGVLEQPTVADIDDAAVVGREAQPFVTGAPNLQPGQRQRFQDAMASTYANDLATGKTSPEQIVKAAGGVQSNRVQQRVQDLIDAGDVQTASAVNQGAKAGTAIKLYQPVGSTGATMSPATGDVNANSDGNPLLFSTLALRRAQALAATASATRRDAAAGGADVPGADGALAAVPGGTGTKLMQDADSGARFAVNEKTGRAWKATDKGWDPVLVTNLPKNLQKFGSGSATQGNRESIFTQRVSMAANQASKDLGNIVKLPLTASTGVFGGRKQGPGLLDAGKEVLANKATSQEVQDYNAMATGFQRSLAAIESAGLMPSVQLSHQMDAVLFKEGDTNLTKLHKLAQIRQIIDAAGEVMLDNPRVSDSEKGRMRKTIEATHKAVPFTHSDLIDLRQAQEINPDATLKDVVGKVGAPPAAQPKNAKGWTLMKDAKGNQAYVSPDGKQFEEVQ